MPNLIDNDPLVSKIMEYAARLEGSPSEKFEALVRAGKIAQVYSNGYDGNWDVANVTFGGTRRTPRSRRTSPLKLDQSEHELANSPDRMDHQVRLQAHPQLDKRQ